MNVLLLPGNSPGNEDEIAPVKERLLGEGHQVLLHRGRHWEEPNVRFDLDLELSRLRALARGFQNREAAEALVCKSLGTFVAAALR